MIPDYAGAVVIPNNNFFASRNGYTPKYIILHGTAGGTSAVAIGNYFASTQGGANPVSSHYIIGTDGTVVQTVSEANGAYGNGGFSAGHDAFWNTAVNPNLTTISIEHCKPSSDNSDVLTTAQYAASKALVKDICKRWDIPMRMADASGGITGHYSLDPVERSRCPGPYPWQDLITSLQEGSSMLELTDALVAKYFKDGGNGTWKCVNGNVLQGANLTFYRSYGGPALFGLPLHNEFYPAQYSGTAIASCERGLITYDPSRKIDPCPMPGPCYLLHIDSGIGQQILLQNGLAVLQAQINTLQSQLAAYKTLGGQIVTQVQKLLAS